MKSLDEILKMCSGTMEFAHLDTPITDVNQHGGSGDTPLHLASQWGDLEAVQTLIVSGADIHAMGEAGRTALFSAVMGGNLDVVKYLLDQGCPVGQRDENGRTALDLARLLQIANALRTPPEVIQLLESWQST